MTVLFNFWKIFEHVNECISTLCVINRILYLVEYQYFLLEIIKEKALLFGLLWLFTHKCFHRCLQKFFFKSINKFLKGVHGFVFE